MYSRMNRNWMTEKNSDRFWSSSWKPGSRKGTLEFSGEYVPYASFTICINDLNMWCSSIGQWFSRLPVVTRSLLVCYLVTGLLGMFDLMPWRLIWHQWSKELSLPIPQVWRWVTNFLVVGTPSINHLFQLVWLYVVWFIIALPSFLPKCIFLHVYNKCYAECNMERRMNLQSSLGIRQMLWPCLDMGWYLCSRWMACSRPCFMLHFTAKRSYLCFCIFGAKTVLPLRCRFLGSSNFNHSICPLHCSSLMFCKGPTLCTVYVGYSLATCITFWLRFILQHQGAISFPLPCGFLD